MSEPNFLRTFSQRRGANVGPSRTCCWIEGEKPYGTDPFCNEPSVSGTSYCADHAKRCFRVVDERLDAGFARSFVFYGSKR